MGTKASQIARLAIFYSAGHWPLCGEFTGEFPAQMATNAEIFSIWWRHNVHGVLTRGRHKMAAIPKFAWFLLLMLQFPTNSITSDNGLAPNSRMNLYLNQ